MLGWEGADEATSSSLQMAALRTADHCLCGHWYLRYSLSYRDVRQLLEERGIKVDASTIWRWVQRYGPELDLRLRRHLKPTNLSRRADET